MALAESLPDAPAMIRVRMAVLLERRDPGLAVLRLDRPERRNALDSAALAELRERLAELAADEALRALVLSTTDLRALSAGADVTEDLDAEGGVARMEAFGHVYDAWDAFPAPTICVCVGDVLGAGAELAAGADLRVAGDNLRLGWVGAKLGVPVGPARLVPLVGLARASELLLTGRLLGAAEAAAIGLVHETAPADGAEGAALGLAERVAGLPVEGVRQMKRLLRRGEGTAERIAQENAVLNQWQRHGAGLPRRDAG
jgi:enoyl-CoA hydratase/carnithine racemase